MPSLIFVSDYQKHKHNAQNFSRPEYKCLSTKMTPELTPEASETGIVAKARTKTHKVVQEPKVNDRFRVKWQQADILGNMRDFRFLGTVKNIEIDKENLGRYILGVAYDDGSYSYIHDYPNDDVQQLIPKAPEKDLKINKTFNAKHDGKGQVFAYDTNPTELFVGDLVSCRYQNGCSNESWYNGRVAAVSNITHSFDVVYFDGEYEKGIPLEKGNVYLLGRGSSSSEKNWIVGAPIEYKSSARTLNGKVFDKNREIFTVKKVETISKISQKSMSVDSSFDLICHLLNGKETHVMSYAKVVHQIFKAIHLEKSIQGKMLRWPKKSTFDHHRKKQKHLKKNFKTTVAKKRNRMLSNQDHFQHINLKKTDLLTEKKNNGPCVFKRLPMIKERNLSKKCSSTRIRSEEISSDFQGYQNKIFPPGWNNGTTRSSLNVLPLQEYSSHDKGKKKTKIEIYF